jgi:hypothetical protein
MKHLKRISFRLRADLRGRLERIAEKTDPPATMTFLVEQCVEGHLSELERRYGLEPVPSPIPPAKPVRYGLNERHRKKGK